MNTKPNHSTSQRGKHSEKSGLLSLSQISELMAQGAVSQHQSLSEAHRSQVYATDLDEFVDIHAWQSVNVNPSTDQGIKKKKTVPSRRASNVAKTSSTLCRTKS